MKRKNMILITTGIFFCLPQLSVAEYKTPSFLMNNQEQNRGTKDFDRGDGFKVLDASSYYDAMTPTMLLQSQYKKPETVTETMKLRDKIKENLKKIDLKEKQSALALKKWNDFEPKIVKIIKKEQELDELLNYISRLKKVSSKRMDPPSLVRNGVDGVKTDSPESCLKASTAYSWPRRCS